MQTIEFAGAKLGLFQVNAKGGFDTPFGVKVQLVLFECSSSPRGNPKVNFKASAEEITAAMKSEFAAWQGTNVRRDGVTAVVFRL